MSVLWGNVTMSDKSNVLYDSGDCGMFSTPSINRLKILNSESALDTNYITWVPGDYVRFAWNDIESLDGILNGLNPFKYSFPLLFASPGERYFVANNRQSVPLDATHWAVIPPKP